MSEKQEMINKINTNLKGAIVSQPQLVKTVIDNIAPQLHEVINSKLARKIEKVYITGCGDSYFAGIATELAFHQFAGIDVQPVEPLNLSRYLSPYLPQNSLVIVISNSGKVSRTIEATRRANKHSETIAITDAQESELAKSAKYQIFPHIPYIPSGGAGTRSYLASLLCLYSIAFQLGLERGHLTSQQYEGLVQELEQVGDQIACTLELCDPATLRLSQINKSEKIFFVGGGPNYATAMFGAAKVMEALSIEGIAVELEEWAHLQFHTTTSHSFYFVVAPPGLCYDRAVEQVRGIKNSGGYVTVIADQADKQISSIADYVLPVASPHHEALSPLLYCVPTELFAVNLASTLNVSMKMRLEEERKAINFQQIFHSEIEP